MSLLIDYYLIFSRCKPIEPPQTNNWASVKTQDYPYFPNSEKNVIVYKFKNINTTKFDVCIIMEYENRQIMSLKVGYKNQTNELFSISLSETQKKFNFCLSNFLNNVEEQFDLSLSVLSNENLPKNYWNETLFQLKSFSPRVEVKNKRPISYIKSWDLSDKSDELKQWTGIPNELFHQNSDPTRIEFKGE
jgi:hypothetical protein